MCKITVKTSLNLPSFEPIVWALVWAKSAVKRIARFGEKIFFLVGKSKKGQKVVFARSSDRSDLDH